MKRLVESTARILFWVAVVGLLVALVPRSTCPCEHHEPRISLRLVSQNP